MPEIIYGQIAPISGEVERGTEAGDTRITESGDTRITNLLLNNAITSSLVIEPTLVTGLFNSYVKVNGVWKESDISVKYNNAWVVPLFIYINLNGVWKRVY